MPFELHNTTATLTSVTPRDRGRKIRRRPLLVTHAGRRVGPHIPIAELALGHPLTPGAEVHHVDENPFNNTPSNLVVCPDAAYHKLLHQRQRAFNACGNYGWRLCHFCKRYDAPENMRCTRKKAVHRACEAEHRFKLKHPDPGYLGYVGEAVRWAKLTDEQVIAIRGDHRTQQAIANAFGTTRSNVSAIQRGLSWRHLLNTRKESAPHHV